jgi:hypothetical protein
MAETFTLVVGILHLLSALMLSVNLAVERYPRVESYTRASDRRRMALNGAVAIAAAVILFMQF